MSWTVFGPKGPYKTAQEPIENADGSLTIVEGQHKGLTLSANVWQKHGSDGPVRQVPRGVTNLSRERPKKNSPVDGFGDPKRG